MEREGSKDRKYLEKAGDKMSSAFCITNCLKIKFII